MNIQQYYRLAANTSLNGSLAALIPVVVLIIPNFFLFPKKEWVLLSVPFLFYSFLSYQVYLINQERFSRSKVNSGEKQVVHPLEESQLLLTFLPAPSLRLLFFCSNGQACGEIKDSYFTKLRWLLPYFLDKMLPAEYRLVDGGQYLLATIRWRKHRAIVKDEHGQGMMTIMAKDNRRFHVITENSSHSIHVKTETLHTDIQFLDENQHVLARVRKGWMPLEWGKSFVDANTPIFSLDENLAREERLAIVAILAKFYRYYNH